MGQEAETFTSKGRRSVEKPCHMLYVSRHAFILIKTVQGESKGHDNARQQYMK